MIDPERQCWQNGWWPADKGTEDYLKAKILECQPDAVFFYAEEFIESLREADEEARRKREDDDTVQRAA